MTDIHIRNIFLEALSEVLNGDDPDGDIDKMYIPDEFIRVFVQKLLSVGGLGNV